MKAGFREGSAPAGRNMPHIVRRIVWAKQIQSQVEEVMNGVSRGFDDLRSSEDLSAAGEEFKAELVRVRDCMGVLAGQY